MLDLNRERLLQAYETMKTIREFEERVHIEFATGEIPGFVHLYAGEEASGTGVCMHLDDRDSIASTHRGHGHCIAKGVEVKGMMAEIYGKENHNHTKHTLCNYQKLSMLLVKVCIACPPLNTPLLKK